MTFDVIEGAPTENIKWSSTGRSQPEEELYKVRKILNRIGNIEPVGFLIDDENYRERVLKLRSSNRETRINEPFGLMTCAIEGVV